jgi:hypothetical protein
VGEHYHYSCWNTTSTNVIVSLIFH